MGQSIFTLRFKEIYSQTFLGRKFEMQICRNFQEVVMITLWIFSSYVIKIWWYDLYLGVATPTKNMVVWLSGVCKIWRIFILALQCSGVTCEIYHFEWRRIVFLVPWIRVGGKNCSPLCGTLLSIAKEGSLFYLWTEKCTAKLCLVECSLHRLGVLVQYEAWEGHRKQNLDMSARGNVCKVCKDTACKGPSSVIPCQHILWSDSRVPIRSICGSNFVWHSVDWDFPWARGGWWQDSGHYKQPTCMVFKIHA